MKEFFRHPAQIVTGTPAERQALSLLGSIDPTNTSGRYLRRVTEAQKTKSKLNRRRFLAGATGLTATLSASFYGLKTLEVSGESGVLDDKIEGKEISEQELRTITTVMRATEHPLMIKAADAVDIFRGSDPEGTLDVPNWLLDEESLPIKILENPDASYSLAVFGAEEDRSLPKFRVNKPNGTNDEMNFSDPLSLAITMGTRDIFPDDYLARGLVLTKEMFSHLVILQAALESKNVMQNLTGIYLSQIDGSMFADQTLKDRAYATTMQQLIHQNSSMLQAVDGFPIMILEKIIEDLINSGMATKEARFFAGINIISDLFNENPNLKSQVNFVIDNWKGVLPDISKTGIRLSEFLFPGSDISTGAQEFFRRANSIDPENYPDY